MRESRYCGRVGDARREVFEEAERRALESLVEGARAGRKRNRAAW